MPLIKNAALSKDILTSNLSEIGCFIHRVGEKVEKHFHDCDEWWYFLKGKAKILNDGKVCLVNNGDLVYTKKGIEHAVVEVTEEIEGIYFSNITKGKKRKGHLHKEQRIKNILIYGKFGTGKKNVIEEYLTGIDSKANILIFDIKNEFLLGKPVPYNYFNGFKNNSLIRIIFNTLNSSNKKEKLTKILRQLIESYKSQKPLVLVVYDIMMNDEIIKLIPIILKNRDIYLIISTEKFHVFKNINTILKGKRIKRRAIFKHLK